jgi:hypothetical protein
MESFYEFMKERIKKTERRESNCGGTSLYIVGDSDIDIRASRNLLKLKLSRMKKSATPGLGYVVSWEENREPFHVAVIYKENPFEIVHRTEANGLLTSRNLEEFNKFMFKATNLKPVYRIPHKLEEELINPQL